MLVQDAPNLTNDNQDGLVSTLAQDAPNLTTDNQDGLVSTLAQDAPNLVDHPLGEPRANRTLVMKAWRLSS
ncbi:hypothetical protein [Lentibacillus saliphilus]|uniref:hypothetical protein n=1 Tax=Lentibacillus saliphilus TaxID=2737028 RepID=UPI001C2F80E2|nr:hypothetical protein [Lentibacillus saliphilus]